GEALVRCIARALHAEKHRDTERDRGERQGQRETPVPRACEGEGEQVPYWITFALRAPVFALGAALRAHAADPFGTTRLIVGRSISWSKFAASCRSWLTNSRVLAQRSH